MNTKAGAISSGWPAAILAAEQKWVSKASPARAISPYAELVTLIAGDMSHFPGVTTAARQIVHPTPVLVRRQGTANSANQGNDL
jgi:hypothetical protein